MVKDTCRKEKCKLWKQFMECCPNYYENMFYPSGKIDEAYKVYDCAPIRTMLLIKEQHSLLISNQKVLEYSRKAIDSFTILMRTMHEKAVELNGNSNKLLINNKDGP